MLPWEYYTVIPERRSRPTAEVEFGRSHPMTCGWAVVQTLVCVLWEEGQIKEREYRLSLVC